MRLAAMVLRTSATLMQFNALVLGFPWQRIGDAGAISMLWRNTGDADATVH